MVNAEPRALFRGRESLRVANEWLLLTMCIVLVAVVVPAIARLIGYTFAIQEFALLVIAGMLLVSLGRGRLRFTEPQPQRA